MRFLIGIAAVGLVLSQSCIAGDFVRVKYLYGYPTTNSNESLEIVVSRDTTHAQMQKMDVDSFFESVQTALEAAHAPSKWEPVPAIDAPTVQIDIALGERRYRLATSFSDSGPLVPQDATEGDRLMRHAFEVILRLTTQRAQGRLAVN